MNLKLADFGLTTKLQFQGDLKHTVCGTPNYIAPQIIKSGMGLGASGHSYQVDIWSTGVIMYLMLIGKAPFQTTAVQKTYGRISKAQFDFPQSFKDNEAKDLLRKILVVDPSKRFTFQQILSHPFMNPKCGIPKQLPLISLTQAPKFGVFDKYAQQPVKKSARDASVMTLRSSVDLSMDQDLQGLDTTKNSNFANGQMQTNRKGKQVKKLLTSVFSTSSLSKSLQKLTDLSRNSSPQSRPIRPIGGNLTPRSNSSSRLNLSSNRLSLHNSNSNSNINMSNGSIIMNGSSVLSRSSVQRDRLNLSRTRQLRKQQVKMQIKKKQLSLVYIQQYTQQVIWSYRLNNGYIGTYQSGYWIIYNVHDGKYVQIEQGNIKQLKKSDQAANQKLNNRKKFIKNYNVNPYQCQPYMGIQRLVYLIKIYKIQKQGLVLFRLNNGYIQAFDYKNNKILLTNQISVIYIELNQGKQVSRISQKSQNYAKYPQNMLKMYLQIRRIINSIKNRKKN